MLLVQVGTNVYGVVGLSLEWCPVHGHLWSMAWCKKHLSMPSLLNNARHYTTNVFFTSRLINISLALIISLVKGSIIIHFITTTRSTPPAKNDIVHHQSSIIIHYLNTFVGYYIFHPALYTLNATVHHETK